MSSKLYNPKNQWGKTLVPVDTPKSKTGTPDNEYIDASWFDTADSLEDLEEKKLVSSDALKEINERFAQNQEEHEQFKKDNDILMTGTLESYKQIRDRVSNNPDISLEPIYIEVPDGIRLKRALEREEKQKEPKYEEMCRRFLADSKDFSEENLRKAGITKRFKNDDLYECIKEITEYLGYLKTEEKER